MRWRAGLVLTIVLAVMNLVAWFYLHRSPYCYVTNLNAAGDLVCVFGDSIPAGVGTAEPWPALVATRLHLKVANRSLPGDTVERSFQRLDQVLPLHPRLVIVELGGNDVLQHVPSDQVRKNLNTLFQKLQANGAMVMFLSIPTPGRPSYQDAFQSACAGCGVCFVSPAPFESVMGESDTMYDAFHPNTLGHEKLTDLLAPRIDDLLAAGAEARGE